MQNRDYRHRRSGRLHYQGFATSNHYGATADGLILWLSRRRKAALCRYHSVSSTGVAYPAQMFGALVTEKVRSLGAQLINVDGVAFMNPLETRDVTAASIIRECTANGRGVPTPLGSAIWLDTPMIDIINGPGTIEKKRPVCCVCMKSWA